jgi:NitT/TauT family transport system substrate-binding protein
VNQGPATEVRLGFYPNVTHAPALIGMDKGFFANALGSSTKITPQTFNAGPDEVTALLGGSLDVAFIGSGPAINAYDKGAGAVRLVAGAASGGAQLVVKPGITSPDQLKGKTIATPQLGNTQDVALKKWLASQKLAIGTGPDQVKVLNTDNPQTLTAFHTGQIDGAWLPEPWSSRLVLDAGAKVLVDERTLWPNGKFPTTVMIVRTQFLQQHPQTVQALLTGELATLDWAAANKAQAETVVNGALQRLTGKALSQQVLDRAFANIDFTYDPQPALFPQLAKDNVTAGVTTKVPNLQGFADFTLLNQLLNTQGKPQIDAAALK